MVSKGKFLHLPTGEKFIFQGERYQKVTHLLASNLETGKQRMIPRSAMVTLDDGRAPEIITQETKSPIEAEPLMEALERYRVQCEQLLEKGVSGETLDTLQKELQQLHHGLLQELGL